MILYILMLVPLVLETCIPYMSAVWAIPANIAVIIAVTAFAAYTVRLFMRSTHEVSLIGKFFTAALTMSVVSFVFNAILVSPQHQISSNLYFTFALGLSLLYLFEYYITESYPTFRKIGIVLFPIILLLALWKAEKASLIIPFMLITYVFEAKDRVRFACYMFLSFVLLIVSLWRMNSGDALNYQFTFILALPFISHLPIRRDLSKNSKFLYIYPLVIWFGHTVVTYM
ncbi:hypothetical protein G7062_01915 [Erysipelothrix sp. HDW6C]|uniref:hypothetical protein n=1 Tax=Erysipelothrix sp. HDW6C TaxID=2714930 RepID=UPI0014084CE9|nr:hypothetical protein [Erysipelothrix sp. HDW6C]QIK69112.1 hypothetical protein G7062_01915 [Erysipelothrix sp. HDW6C]